MFKVRWAMINLCTKIKKYFGLLPSLSVKKNFNQYLASYKQECGCLMHFAHLANTLSLFWCVHCIDSRQVYALHSNRQLKHKRQEAQLSPRDRAMRCVSWNFANCHATVQKLLVREVLNKSKLWSWRVTLGQCVINMCTQPWRDRVASIVL